MFTSHFQTFDIASTRHLSAARLDALRQSLHDQGIDGFLVPRADEHQNEYVPAHAERLAWLTGFTGSAGLALILPLHAALCIDGRYTLQARQQIDLNCFDPLDYTHSAINEWLQKHLTAGMKIGFDPLLITPQQFDRLNAYVTACGATLIALERNPIDHLWHDKPPTSISPLVIHPQRYAGEQTHKKLKRVYADLKGNTLLMSDPHNVCWLMNIRGNDVAHTPLVMSYAILREGEKPRLYIDPHKLTTETRSYLETFATLCAPHQLRDDCASYVHKDGHIILDQATCSHAIYAYLQNQNAAIKLEQDPVTLLKAKKNKTEIKGAIKAHLRDGAALTSFLHWLSITAPKKKVTEIDAAEALEHFRRSTKKLKDISFPTISGFGANGASPHYRVTRSSNARLGKGFYLIDSGAQYEDGTTDVTRTIALSPPTQLMRAHYTRVLKGHIAIARAIFPRGTSGAQIDAFARAPLWEIGEDFDHGTGHGVGSYLSVHEGPQRISKLGTIALEEGMILSNEPAFYKEGAYGIRLENLIYVAKYDAHQGSRDMLHFKNLTLAPFDRHSINKKLLTPDEKKWLNDYHAHVRQALSPLLDTAARAWLKKATQKI